MERPYKALVMAMQFINLKSIVLGCLWVSPGSVILFMVNLNKIYFSQQL